MAGKALSTVNCRERRWRPANSLSHHMASSLPESPANQFLYSINNLQKSDLTSALHFPRSKLHYTPEEYSHWLSLMARDFSLGPSDAPWPVETSTAHGEPSFWEPNLSMGKVNLYGGTASISSIDHSRIRSNQSSPERDLSLEASSPVSIRRRFLHPTWPTKPFLGFWLEGLTHKIGPITSLKPKSSRYEASYNVKNPRLGPIIPLLSLKQCICRFLSLSGRRHQKSRKPYSLFWRCNNPQRILVLASSMAAPIQLPQARPVKFRTWPPNLSKFLQRSRQVYDPCFTSRTELLSDLEGLRSANLPPMESLLMQPSSSMERTICNLPSFMEKTVPTFLLSCEEEVICLMPVRIEVLDTPSKSKCQSTKTIHHRLDLLVDVVSTNHLLACGNVAYRSCLRVVDLPSKYLINLSYAFINVLNLVVLSLDWDKLLNSVFALII